MKRSQGVWFVRISEYRNNGLHTYRQFSFSIGRDADSIVRAETFDLKRE